MITKPKALDLYCKAGGATKGLQRAGFHVTGVDIEHQPRYCGDEFVQADALTFPLEGFDFIWASPPCQAYSIANRIHRDTHPPENYPDHIATLRERFVALDVPYIIENVNGAPLRYAVMLCGQVVGLPHLYRHRYFESDLALFVPPHVRHTGYTNACHAYSSFEKGATVICVGGHNFNFDDGKLAMGIDWMNKAELAQAIPPAYSELLGRQVITYLEYMSEQAA